MRTCLICHATTTAGRTVRAHRELCTPALRALVRAAERIEQRLFSIEARGDLCRAVRRFRKERAK